ncbi:NAD(P)-binding domain-containing protein [Streptomyces sp. NPDC052179]|uniref:NAD(P)-dependent oxidoreductase n=1 Tax=Streptomyces sp. NPDC052179 TaxID=3155680 RepID=UPI003433E77E
MPDNTSEKTPISLLGLGAMGTALARTWLAAGHPLTLWNRSPGRSAALAADGARVASTAAEAVAENGLVVLCLLDDASVGDALADADLTGKDLVDLTTTTPAEARERARWAAGRGARFLDGGIMAIPSMIGTPGSGGYVLYSGSRELFEDRKDVLTVPAGTKYVGADAGFAALYDVALLSAMYGMFAGISHAFALVREEEIEAGEFGSLLADWLIAMAPHARSSAAGPDGGDPADQDTTSPAVVAAGNATLLRTAVEQGVGTGPLTAFMAATGEDAAG